MPLTPAQLAMCAAIFGAGAGSVGTVAVQKKISPKPPLVSAKGKGERVQGPPSRPRVGRVENRIAPAPSRSLIMACPEKTAGVELPPEFNFEIPSAKPPAGGVVNGPASVGGGGWLITPGRPPLQIPAVPAPDSWILWIAGFGLVGTSFRRRKATA